MRWGKRLPEGYRRELLPLTRRLAVDAALAGRNRHAMHGLIEVDVTEARRRMKDLPREGGRRGSMTAFVTASVARAAARHPHVHAFQDWRGRLLLADHVHVAAMVETALHGESLPLVHLLRHADRRGVLDLTADLQSAKADPSQGSVAPLLPYMGLFLRLPTPVRIAAYRAFARSPRLREQVSGTVVVSAVGMFARGGGWGLSFPSVYSLGVTIGGLVRKPTVVEDRIEPRDLLALTLTFDHDLVDGAPAARFAHDLMRMIETAEVLPEPARSP